MVKKPLNLKLNRAGDRVIVPRKFSGQCASRFCLSTAVSGLQYCKPCGEFMKGQFK